MVKPRHEKPDFFPGCAVEAAIHLIDGKWKCVVLWHLLTEGTLRFNELRRRIPKVTQRMLTNQLRELEEDGVIHREVYPVVPPKVEYSLTDMGRELEPILRSLHEWGAAHMDIYERPKVVVG
ncbi:MULTISPECIES: winged helix-turn-helix transcriptional regulator [unclassified Shimia]|uniref:winged helix-turn-helix transcriptional regulator n=1 Tax=unclassified Shimia TaxID=2630038 RepID=UPI003109A2E2